MHQLLTYAYLIEVETPDHRFVMVTRAARRATAAVASAVELVGGLNGHPVACAKDAPEFGDTCKRELIG